MERSTTVRALAAIALCAVTAGGPRMARAQGGDASGALGSGGTAHGDIAKRAGETDHVTIELDAGATLVVDLRATFQATLVLADPDGAPVDLGTTAGTRLSASIPVATAGLYTFAIASADGTQGIYALRVRQSWPHTIAISGSGAQEVDVPMPAGAKLSGVVGRRRGASGAPRIDGLLDPNGMEMLAEPLEAKGNVVRMPPASTTAAGVYRLRIGTTDGSSAWTGTLRRRVPHQAPTSLRLANGLDALSFRADGVGAVFSTHCAPCHGWATSYGSVRGNARAALGRMLSGAMPPGGGLSRAEIALVQAWIKTGMNP